MKNKRNRVIIVVSLLALATTAFIVLTDKRSRKSDLLQKIYPDSGMLRNCVNRNEYVYPFTDIVAGQTILHNAQKDNGLDVDSLMNAGSRRSSLKYKYFGTPLLR